MLNKELFDAILYLTNDLLFRKGFLDFFRIMQRDGIEAARSFWQLYPFKNDAISNAIELSENIADFYFSLDLVPRAAHDAVCTEHQKLQYENAFLMEILMQLQFKMFTESAENVWKAWQSTFDKQIEIHKQVCESYFEILRQWSPAFCGRTRELPSTLDEKRREKRFTFVYPVDVLLSDTNDNTMKGLILNISDTGLCINSFAPLNMGQEIRIQSRLPLRHHTYTARWNKASVSGLAIVMSESVCGEHLSAIPG